MKTINKKRGEKLNVGVFFGGRSSEHEVSLISAKAIMDSMDKKKYEIIPVGITKSGNFTYLSGSMEPADIIEKGDPAVFIAQPNIKYNLWIMNNEGLVAGTKRIDIAFPALHGPYGEDGKIQGLFEMACIPYVGSGVLGSACGMDKVVMKRLFEAAGLPVVGWLFFEKSEFENDEKKAIAKVKKTLSPPYFVKPANLGSSVGITKVSDPSGLSSAIREALKYDYRVVIEQGVDAREIEVAIMGNFDLTVAEPGEVIPFAEFYDYKDKYSDGKSKFEIPVRLPRATIVKIKNAAAAAYRSVCARGFSRVDLFMERSGGKIFLNEINTIPGFTSISMFPKMFMQSGLSFARIVEKLIDYSLELDGIKKGLKV